MYKVIPITDVLEKAKQAELTGNYEQGLANLAFFWDYEKPHLLPSIDDYKLEDFADLLKACGILYGFWGVSQKDVQEVSKNLLTECQKIYLALLKKEEAFSCGNYLALAYSRIGTMDDARVWLAESLEELPEDHPVRIHAHSIDCLIDISEEKYSAAIEKIFRLKPIFEKAQDDYLTATILSYLGLAYRNLGNSVKALRYTEESFRLLKKIKHHRYVSSIGNNLAFYYKSKGDFDKALSYAIQSLEIAQKVGDLRQIGVTYDTHALICYDLKQFDMALFYSEKAIESLKETDNYIFLIRAIETKVQILWISGKFGEAVLNCSEAIEIARRYVSTAEVNRLTNIMHGIIDEKCLVKVFREGRAISVFENYILNFDGMKHRSATCIEIHSNRYIDLGIEKGSLAVVEESEVRSGDFAAIRKINSPESFIGFINFQPEGFVLKLDRNHADLKLSSKDFTILGKVIGYCDEPKPGEIELKVKPLRIKNLS